MESLSQSFRQVALVWMQLTCAISVFDRCDIINCVVFSQFAISGETESLGSNNLMGQWLSAIGGYTVEQIGLHKCCRHTRYFC